MKVDYYGETIRLGQDYRSDGQLGPVLPLNTNLMLESHDPVGKSKVIPGYSIFDEKFSPHPSPIRSWDFRKFGVTGEEKRFPTSDVVKDCVSEQ